MQISCREKKKKKKQQQQQFPNGYLDNQALHLSTWLLD